jgi:hypothetical protein
MQPPKSHICVICGIEVATTRDHVPPKGLFKGVVDANLITVPACQPCNNRSSPDDEDMRAFISMQVGKQTPETAQLWDKGALKSIKRKTALRNQVLSTAQKIALVGEDGVAVTRLAVEIPAKTIESVFGRTTRGLYFFHTGRILDPSCRVEVTPQLARQIDPLYEQFQYNEIGGSACRYWYGIVSADPTSTLWLYCFYHSVWIQVLTGAMCEDVA